MIQVKSYNPLKYDIALVVFLLESDVLKISNDRFFIYSSYSTTLLRFSYPVWNYEYKEQSMQSILVDEFNQSALS